MLLPFSEARCQTGSSFGRRAKGRATGTMQDETIEQFIPLSAAGQALLRGAVQYHHFRDAGAVIHKGQAVSGAYLVTHGRLRVFTYTPQGNEATLYFITGGETCVLALNCLFNDLRYPAWVESEADTRVAFIPGATYRRLFESEPAVQDLTVQGLSTLVFRLMGELEQIHACNLDQRLANFLLTHASVDGVLRMTQQVLAAHLGTSREVVARLLGGFVEQGWVATRRGEVALLNSEALARQLDPLMPAGAG